MKRDLIICAALLASLCANAQTSAPAPLTNDELIALVKGKTIATENTRWGPVTLQFKEDGSLFGNNKSGNDSGKWRTVDGKLCLEWRRWDYEGCGTVQKAGTEIQHLWPNGSVHFIHRP